MTKLGLRGVEDLPVNYDLNDVVQLFDTPHLLTTLQSPFSPTTTYTRQLSSELPWCDVTHQLLLLHMHLLVQSQIRS